MIVAVDFGTTNTVAVAVWGHRPPRRVTVDGVPTMPSAVLLGHDGKLVVGQDALRLGRAAAARLEPRPKARLDEDTILLGDRAVSVLDAVRAVLSRVCQEVGPVEHLVLTHPADWGPVRLGRFTQAATGLAARVSLVPEPVAAVAGSGLAPGGTRAVLDFGGGTCDAAVVRAGATGYEVLACAGLPDLGGDDLDQRLVDLVLAQVPPAVATRLSTLDHAVLRDRLLLRQDAQAAKELLTRHEVARIAVPGMAEPVVVHRVDFERRVSADLARAADLLDDVLATAGARVDEVVLVGGSSRIPALGELLRARVAGPVTATRDPEAVVAGGALAVTAPRERTSPHPVVLTNGATHATEGPTATVPTTTEGRMAGAAGQASGGWPAPPRDARPATTGGTTTSGAAGQAADGWPKPAQADRSWSGRGDHTGQAASGTWPGSAPPQGRRRRMALVAASVAAPLVAVLVAVLVWPADHRGTPAASTPPPATATRGTPVTGPSAPPPRTVPSGQSGRFDAEALDRVLEVRVDSLTAQPAITGYRWVRADVTVTMLFDDSDMVDPSPMRLVDDRGQRIVPYARRATCAGSLPPLSAGQSRAECQEFLVPDATPVAGVMYDDFSRDEANRGGFVLATTLPAAGTTKPLGVVGEVGGPARETEIGTGRHTVRIDEVIEAPSAYLSDDSRPMNGSRYVVVRLTVTAGEREFRAEDFAYFQLVDDRGLPLPEERVTPARLVNCPTPHRIAPAETATACVVLTAGTRTPLAGVSYTGAAPHLFDTWRTWLLT